jgi:hypothetical protein
MTNAPDFRHSARTALERARAELASNEPYRFRYAALELRDAMEALTYDRAMAYKNDIPPEEYYTWQPRKLMMVLLGVDPDIGKSSTLAIGIEDEYGKPVPPEQMLTLGTDHVLGLADLKTHYDALGSYLHMPSLSQIQAGKIADLGKLRERCEAVAHAIEKVLSSKVWNNTLGNIATLERCMNEDCGKPLHRRMPFGQEAIEARCFECNAEYTVASQNNHEVRWIPKMSEVRCASPESGKVPVVATRDQAWNTLAV